MISDIPDLEIFGVKTNSLVISNQDIENENVLGKKFKDEIKKGRGIFGGVKNDPRIDDMDKLIKSIDDEPE